MAAKKKKSASKKKAAAPAKKKAAPAKKKKAAPAKKKAAPKKKVAAKPAPKKKAKAAAKPAKKKAAAKLAPRRDATGHLNPKYAKELRERSRETREAPDGDAFIRKSRAHDSLAEELGEEAVAAMTSGEDQSDRLQEQEVEEESGGPFVRTGGREEYAGGTDASNPSSATREPFPKT